MEQNVETASSYYNDKRKQSFFLSRIFVIISMLVLVAALGINVSVLYQQERTSTTSQASSDTKQTNLPDLPKGCEYQSKGKGVVVVCPTAAPTITQTATTNAQFPVNVRLPKLPAQCEYVNSMEGTSIECTSAQPAVPTVAVTANTSCLPSAKKDMLDCTGERNQVVAVQLPALPGGCVYKLVGKNYVVDCNAAPTAN